MERGDWDVDSEGNLTPPDELKPNTDEFGRDDPDALERERRRREREMRRRGQKPPKEKKGVTGGFGKVLGGRRRKRDEPPPPEATAQQPAAPPDPTAEQAARPAPRRARQAPAAARPTMGERAAAGRDALRRQVRGGRGGEDDGAESPPKASRRFGGGGNYGRRRFAALALAFVAILLGWFLIALFQPFAGDGEGDGTVTVEIPEGTDGAEAAEILDENGVISSAALMKVRLRLAGESEAVEAGTYTFGKGMSYSTAIDRLTSQDTGGAITVTIPEGYDRNQVADLVLPEGVSSEEYLELTTAPPQGSNFNPATYGAKAPPSLEGFLFPATYDLQEGQGSAELVQQQLDSFQDNIAKVDMAYAKKKNLTVYDVLIIASMIDKEVQVAKERPLVAAVIYNRLRQGIPLGIDATTRFETQNYTEQIPQSDLEANTPFNTRLNAGLTPTPIGNPGLESIKAAAAPARVNYIYFVVKPGTCGEHSFTASEKEFEQLAAEYQQALQEQGGSPTTCPE